MKQQVNVRISDATREKLDWLTERHGTQAEVIAVAIALLHVREENGGRFNVTELLAMGAGIHESHDND